MYQCTPLADEEVILLCWTWWLAIAARRTSWNWSGMGETGQKWGGGPSVGGQEQGRSGWYSACRGREKTLFPLLHLEISKSLQFVACHYRLHLTTTSETNANASSLALLFAFSALVRESALDLPSDMLLGSKSQPPPQSINIDMVTAQRHTTSSLYRIVSSHPPSPRHSK